MNETAEGRFVEIDPTEEKPWTWQLVAGIVGMLASTTLVYWAAAHFLPNWLFWLWFLAN